MGKVKMLFLVKLYNENGDSKIILIESKHFLYVDFGEFYSESRVVKHVNREYELQGSYEDKYKWIVESVSRITKERI